MSLTKKQKLEMFNAAVETLYTEDSLYDFNSPNAWTPEEKKEFLLEHEERINATVQSMHHLVEREQNRIDPETHFHVTAVIRIYEAPKEFDSRDVSEYPSTESKLLHLNCRLDVSEALAIQEKALKLLYSLDEDKGQDES